MSDALDYWPFDYARYVDEILPALKLATEDQPAHLQQLIETGKQQGLSLRSPWVRSRWPGMEVVSNAISTQVLLDPGSLSRLGLSSVEEFVLQRYFNQSDLTWELFGQRISQLRGRHFGEIFPIGAELHICLVYAFCSAPMPGGIEAYQPPVGGGEDESVSKWRDYFEREEVWSPLWRHFYQPPPAAITAFIPSSYDEAYPRDLNPFGEADGRVTINGFLTPEETRQMARELPLRRKPFLFAVCDQAASEYVMREWEKRQMVIMEDYKERKRQFYQERREYNRQETEKSLKERLFGQELGSLLIDVERYFPFEDPEDVGDRFFLVPKDLYREIHLNHRAIVRQWIENCPEEVEELHMPFWEGLWQSEEELMRRLNYAVSHNWGMLMYYTSGK